MLKFVTVLLAFLYSGTAMAASAVVQTATGNVTAAIGANAPAAITQNSVLESGTTVTTGDNGQVVIKFEDGQVIALNANTTFKISQYHYNQAKPEKSSMFFSLLKGAMRSVSGLIAKHNAAAYRLQTPVATIGIRGTDFMAATGSLYLQVINGTVSATTTAGTTAFAAGQVGFVSTLSTIPAAISAAQLPASVASSFSQLGSMAVSGAGAATGSTTSGGTTGSTTGSTAGTGGTAGTGSTAGTTGAATGGTAGTTSAAVSGTTAAGGTAVGGTAAAGAAVGSLSTVAVVGSVAAAAGLVAVATNNNTTAATTTVTVTAP
jgi:hypothetical protein